MAAPEAANAAPPPETVADLSVSAPWNHERDSQRGDAIHNAGLEHCSSMLPAEQSRHWQRAASLGPVTPSEALERPSAAPHVGVSVSRSASPDRMPRSSTAAQVAMQWHLLHGALRVGEGVPVIRASETAQAHQGLAEADTGAGGTPQEPEQAGCIGDADGKGEPAALLLEHDKATGAARQQSAKQRRAGAGEGQRSIRSASRGDEAAAKDSSRAADRGAPRRSHDDPARGSRHMAYKGAAGRRDDSRHAGRHGPLPERRSSRETLKRGETGGGRETVRRRELERSREADRSRAADRSRELDRRRVLQPTGAGENSRERFLNRVTGQARRILGTVADCTAQLSSKGFNQLRALQHNEQMQAAQDFADAVRRAQKGNRDLRLDAWLAHFVRRQQRGLVLSNETRATLDTLLGSKRLSVAERAPLAQLLPEEQAGLLQQLADSEKRVAAKRIANPCGWLAATARRIREGQLTTAWQVPPPHAAAAVKLPASTPTSSRPTAAAKHSSAPAAAAPAARGPPSPAAPRPVDALLEARSAVVRATPATRPLAAAGAAAGIPRKGQSAGRTTDRTANLVRQATRTAAGRPAAAARAEAARRALPAASAPARQAQSSRDEADGRPVGAAGGGSVAAPAGRLGASTAALGQGAAARDVGAPASGRHKRKFPDRPATTLEESGVACKQDMLTPAPKRLRRERWGRVGAAALPPHAEPAQMEPGSWDVQSTDAGASRDDAAHAEEEEPPGAPLLQAAPGFAMLVGAVQSVLLALVHARLLRDGGLDEACLAELAALPPEEQHEVTAELDDCLTHGKLAHMPARIVRDRIQALHSVGPAKQPDIPCDIKESLYGLLDEGRSSGRMHGCLDAAFHTELAASSRVVQLEFLRDFGNAVRNPSWNIKNLQVWSCKAISRHRQEAIMTGLPAVTEAPLEAGTQGPPPSWALTLPMPPGQQPSWQRQNWDILCGS